MKDVGAVWAWGSNADSAIGIVEEDESGAILDEQFECAKAPRFVRELCNVQVSQIACGNRFSAVLSNTGEVWTWGNGKYGKLGHMDEVNQPLPKKIVSFETVGVVNQIACGQEHMLALSGGVVYSWGCGIFGRLGHGNLNAVFEPKEIKSTLGGYVVENIWAGATSFALDNRGTLWAWGSAGYPYGQLGNGDKKNEQQFPVISNLQNVTHLSCSERHVVAIVDNALYSWGSNNVGQLGTGSLKDAVKPVRVVIPALPGTPPEDLTVIHASCGGTYTAVVTRKGEVYTCGKGDEGELGHKDLVSSSTSLVKVQFPTPTNVSKVSCGLTFMMALTTQNTIYAWGTDKQGQLGVGGKFEEEQTKTVAKENVSMSLSVEEESLEIKFGISTTTTSSPKKGKKPRANPSTPAKRKEAGSTTSSKQATSATAALATSRPVLIRWMYDVTQVTCGNSHSLALVKYNHRLLQIARDGDFKSAQEILKDVGDSPSYKFVNEDSHYAPNFSFLHWLAYRNSHQALTIVLGTFKHFIENTSNGQTPLHVASFHGHLESVKVLIDSKANINVRDSQGNTPLHFAAVAKRIDICSHLILNGASADIQNRNAKKPLEYFSLNDVFELKKQIGVFDVAIFCSPEDLQFSKELSQQIEKFHIACSLNETNLDPKAFIKASRALIFVLSDFSAKASESLHYLNLAKEAKKHVYPIWKQKATMSTALESLIYRNQLVDFTDPAKFVDSTAQLVGGLRNIFEDKLESAQDTVNDDSAEVDAAFSNLVEHPNMQILPADLLYLKKQYLYLCHDSGDSRKAALLAASLCEHGFICCYYNADAHVVGDLITNCWTFLLILSSGSAASSVVRDQIALAENRQKLILPVLVQKSPISMDPAMTYTLARTARFPFFVGDNDIEACVAKLVDAVRLAKQVSLQSEKLKNLREEVVVATDKLKKSDAYMAQFKSKVQSKSLPKMKNGQ